MEEEEKTAAGITHVHLRLSFEICLKLDPTILETQPQSLHALQEAMGDPEMRLRLMSWLAAFKLVGIWDGGYGIYRELWGDQPKEGKHWLDYEDLFGALARWVDSDDLFEISQGDIVRTAVQELLAESF